MFKQFCFTGVVAVVVLICASVVGAREPEFPRTADAARLFLLNQQRQEARRNVLDSLRDEQLIEAEAARAGTTVSELLNHLDVPPVTDAEILHTFRQIKAQQPAVTYKQLLPVLKMYLQGRHRAEAKAKFIAGLRQPAR